MYPESRASNRITEVTRRNIFDEIRLTNINWSGRLSETGFLSRVFDLRSLPSNDYRFNTMAEDVAHHRENWNDGDDFWIFDDLRLDLLGCDDEKLLLFLCEMVHPVVRPDSSKAAEIVELCNKNLARDGFRIAERANISGKPVYSGAEILTSIGVTSATQVVVGGMGSEHVLAQITRMEMSIHGDPALAIGTAKEFIETVCKGILHLRGVVLSGGEDLPKLVKLTREILKLDVDRSTEETLKRTLSSLATITQGIAELRGQLGTGHGHHPSVATPPVEVARLAVTMATALGVFLYETHTKTP